MCGEYAWANAITNGYMTFNKPLMCEVPLFIKVYLENWRQVGCPERPHSEQPDQGRGN